MRTEEGNTRGGGVRKPWTKETTRKEVCLKKQKKVDEKAHDGAATPRVVLLLLLLSRSSSGERQRQYIYIYIYIHSVQRKRRRRWRQHLKLHARQINHPPLPESEVLFPDCARRDPFTYI